MKDNSYRTIIPKKLGANKILQKELANKATRLLISLDWTET